MGSIERIASASAEPAVNIPKVGFSTIKSAGTNDRFLTRTPRKEPHLHLRAVQVSGRSCGILETLSQDEETLRSKIGGVGDPPRAGVLTQRRKGARKNGRRMDRRFPS